MAYRGLLQRLDKGMEKCHVLRRKMQRATSAFPPACIGFRRCLRWPSQQPASDDALQPLKISRLEPQLLLAELMGSNTRMPAEETAEVRVASEAQQFRYLLDGFIAVAQENLRRTHDFIGN